MTTHIYRQEENTGLAVSLQVPIEESTSFPEIRQKVAYIMSRFPKITETFILFEMLEMEKQDIQVELYPLIHERAQVMHPEAKPFVERAHFEPFFSFQVLVSLAEFLFIKPKRILSTLWTVVRANWGSIRFLSRALIIFPKAVYFARMMESEDIAHIHAHFASHPALAAYIIHRLVNIPYSFTAHGSDLHRDRHMLREKVEAAEFVVAISEYNRNLIVSECKGKFHDKVKVIHCGVDTHVFKPLPDGKRANPFTIICIGTLHEVKGQSYLVEACRLLRDKGIDFICKFVGDGPDESLLIKQINQAGLSNLAHILGRLTRDNVSQQLREADVLVTPSVPTSDGRREGIPVVLMEAMSSGLPVIASNISGIPELVDDGLNGILVPPRDARAIFEALESLFYNPALRKNMGRAGREKVVQDFDLGKNAIALAGCIRK
jgi:colanic acid/amylovoran biosynthesis glycosyltransferase